MELFFLCGKEQNLSAKRGERAEMLFLKLKVVGINSAVKYGPKITYADENIMIREFLENVVLDDKSSLSMEVLSRF